MVFNHDQFHSASPALVAEATMRVIDRIQQLPPSVQIHAAAAVFVLLTQRFAIDTQDAFSATSNLMNYAEGRRPEFEAVRAYLENEL